MAIADRARASRMKILVLAMLCKGWRDSWVLLIYSLRRQFDEIGALELMSSSRLVQQTTSLFFR